METEKLNLEPNLKELTIQPENEIRDHSGNLIKEIKLMVTHGSGRATGASYISIELMPESAAPVNAGGYKIENNKLTSIGGSQLEEDETTPVGQLARAVNNYFANNPSELEGLKKELQKPE